MSEYIDVIETFFSIQGESTLAGLPALFIRMAGCNLRCKYCDTAYAFKGGRRIGINEILANLPRTPWFHVTLTGGEPLLQSGAIELARALRERGVQTVVFTNGSRPISALPKDTIKVMDIKSPWCETTPPHSFTEFVDTRYLDHGNLSLLQPHDQVKFVIRNRAEFDWAMGFLDRYVLQLEPGNIIFSPETTGLSAHDLGKWLMEARRPVRLGLQVHKFLNLDPEPAR